MVADSIAARTLLPRVGIALLALVLVAAALGLAAWLAGLWFPPPPPPPRNPFGTALPREALPATTGIGVTTPYQRGTGRGLGGGGGVGLGLSPYEREVPDTN